MNPGHRAMVASKRLVVQLKYRVCTVMACIMTEALDYQRLHLPARVSTTCKLNLNRTRAILESLLVIPMRISERFLKIFWTFSCVIFPVISCFLNEWNSRNSECFWNVFWTLSWTSETWESHVIILLVECLVICMSKTREIYITIEHVSSNVHYSRESAVSILCIYTYSLCFSREILTCVILEFCLEGLYQWEKLNARKLRSRPYLK